MTVHGQMRSSPSLLAFHSRWKLDLYYQLRSQEIFGRVDKACQLFLTPNGMRKEAVVEDTGGTNTIDIADVNAIQKLFSVSQFQLPTSRIIATELGTCLHSRVLLPSLASRFFGLAVQVLLKLQTAVATVAGGSAAGETALSSMPASTPSKGGQGSAAAGAVNTSPATPSPVPSAVASAGVTVAYSNDDLAVLTADLEILATWVDDFFTEYCDGLLPYRKANTTTLSPVSFNPILFTRATHPNNNAMLFIGVKAIVGSVRQLATTAAGRLEQAQLAAQHRLQGHSTSRTRCCGEVPYDQQTSSGVRQSLREEHSTAR